MKLDRDAAREAYLDVRDDKTDTNWIVLKYNGSGDLELSGRGVDFEEFRQQFADDERAYGYLRLFTGDELSRRAKFVFITWIGRGVSHLKRARTGTEKGVVKEVLQSFAVECQFGEEDEEFSEASIRDLVVKAGGANYGTGVRG